MKPAPIRQNVTINGSNGDDLCGPNGNDSILAGSGNDVVDAGGGNDNVYGGDGNDYIAGGLGVDALFGGAGDDVFSYVGGFIWSGGYTLASVGSSALFATLVNLDGKPQLRYALTVTSWKHSSNRRRVSIRC